MSAVPPPSWRGPSGLLVSLWRPVRTLARNTYHVPIRATPCPFALWAGRPAYLAHRFRVQLQYRDGVLTAGGSNRLLTPEEVAEWLKVSDITVRNKYRQWGLKAQKVGRLLRFRERDIVAYLEDNYG